MKKTGKIIAGILTLLLILTILFYLLGDKYSYKPDKKDLIGEYHIVKVTRLNFNKETSNNYKLNLYSNGNFTLTKTPFIEIYGNGKYDVDYDDEYNELSLEYSMNGKHGFTVAHINRTFFGYKIEFIIGDPDSGESIYFEKITTDK